MHLMILKPGFLSTIQDLGRHHFLSEAVPVSGAMDTLSARIANIVLGNPENAATIEITFAGAELLAETDMLIAFSGNGAVFSDATRLLPSDRPIFIPAGTTLKLEKNTGCRSYLAVAGGWDVPEVMGSRSTYLMAGFGGLKGRSLVKGDLLKNTKSLSVISQAILMTLTKSTVNFPVWAAAKPIFSDTSRKVVRVIPGRELADFTANSLLNWLSFPYRLGERSNRMAYYLEGPKIEKNQKQELISTAVTPGTIQIAGDGKPLLLMYDCQVTGGYPRIAQVADVDLPLCGQLKPGDEIFFEYISRKEAEKLLLKQEQLIRQLKASVKEKYTTFEF